MNHRASPPRPARRLPAFKVWCLTLGDDPCDPDDSREVQAISPDDAATEYVEKLGLDEFDCPAHSGRPLDIKVEDADGVITHWRVTGDFSVNYYANEAPAGAEGAT